MIRVVLADAQPSAIITDQAGDDFGIAQIRV